MDIIFTKEFVNQRDVLAKNFLNVLRAIEDAIRQDRKEFYIPFSTLPLIMDCLKKCGFKITPTTTQPSLCIDKVFDLYEIKF